MCALLNDYASACRLSDGGLWLSFGVLVGARLEGGRLEGM